MFLIRLRNSLQHRFTPLVVRSNRYTATAFLKRVALTGDEGNFYRFGTHYLHLLFALRLLYHISLQI